MWNRRFRRKAVVGFVLLLSVSAVEGLTLIEPQVKPGAAAELAFGRAL